MSTLEINLHRRYWLDIHYLEFYVGYHRYSRTGSIFVLDLRYSLKGFGWFNISYKLLVTVYRYLDGQ